MPRGPGVKITVSTASEMGKRSAQARKERVLQREREAIAALNYRQNPSLLVIAKLEREMDRLWELVVKSKQAVDIDRLTRSRERLLKEWLRLTGQLDGTGNGKQRRQPRPVPIAPSPIPQPVVITPKTGNAINGNAAQVSDTQGN